eukprot:Partr_v1_DN28426_c0_g1_i1_m41577 putative sequence-specific DNA binding
MSSSSLMTADLPCLSALPLSLQNAPCDIPASDMPPALIPLVLPPLDSSMQQSFRGFSKTGDLPPCISLSTSRSTLLDISAPVGLTEFSLKGLQLPPIMSSSLSKSLGDSVGKPSSYYHPDSRLASVADKLASMRSPSIQPPPPLLSPQPQVSHYPGMSSMHSHHTPSPAPFIHIGQQTAVSNKRRKSLSSENGHIQRCHSCNCTETPEWRRGPDGARTLCNACGLHYAKLLKRSRQSEMDLASKAPSKATNSALSMLSYASKAAYGNVMGSQ